MASLSPAVMLGACAIAASAVCGGALLTGAVQAPAGLTFAAPTGPTPVSFSQAARLAKQASFGPSAPLVNQIVAAGLEPWLDAQFAARESSYADLAALAVPRNYCAAKTGTEAAICARDYLSATPMQMRFYADAVTKEDQLRQRLAWALSELIVASDVQVHSTAGLATLNQIFLDNAFGNYRDILKAVTLNPYMGDYLNLVDSNKAAPSENYARELMQLFSLGVSLLNPDGTVQKDAAGAPVATYGSTDVREIARALTGWTYARLPGATATDGNSLDYSKPMVPAPARYDTGAKTFLGRTVPANASQQASVDAVVDAVFNHANTAPYVSKRLIQALVTSNPSPGFVGRAARVFADNGAGVRGDLKAVVRAILTDPEARPSGDVPNVLTEGKVKEPVLLSLGLARAVGMTTDGYAFIARDTAMGQQPFRAPSVFNFYPPDYPLPLGDNLVSPASKLMTTATILARHNLVYDWTISADGRGEFKPQATIAGSTGTAYLWDGWGADVDAQITRIELLMLDSALSPSQRSAIRAAMVAVTDKDPAVQGRKRLQTGLYLAASSPLFQIDR